MFVHLKSRIFAGHAFDNCGKNQQDPQVLAGTQKIVDLT
jgi:hypothetical protein